MLEKVERFCQVNQLLPKGAGVLVACSGGPDSLALLEVLWRLRGRYQLRVAAAHFEHGIRGEASEADARFVQDFCARQGIPCYLGAADVPLAASRSGQSLEQAARTLRYAFLEETRRSCGLELLATAHHADDQAETVLMRILRGTGTAGLAAMRPRSGTDGHIIRPFLGVTKQEIQDWCDQEKLQPRLDETNALPDCTRNRLRLQLLPQLERDYNPELARGLCQLAEVAADESDYLEQQVTACWQDARYVRHSGQPALSQAGLQSLHSALQRLMIRRFWLLVSGSGKDLGFVHAELIRRLLLTGTTGSRQQLPGGFTAQLSYGWLTCCRSDAAAKRSRTGQPPLVMPLRLPGTVCLGTACVTARLLDVAELPAHTGRGEFFMDPAGLSEPLVLRYRQPGDWISLPSGRKKLKELFIDDRIPREARADWPLLAVGNEILWVIGKRRTSHFSVNQNIRNKRILYLMLEKREEINHDE